MPRQKKGTTIIKQNVGIDVSKDDLKVSFQRLDQMGKTSIKGSRTFKNTLAGFSALMNWIEKKRMTDLAVRITLEATGVYHENLVHFLDDNGYYVSVVLANQSKAYAKSLNLKTKTDRVDARMLGQMGIERDLMQWKPASTKMRIIKQLTRDRLALLDEKTALSNKLHALKASFEPRQSVLDRLEQRLSLLQNQIKTVEKEIKQAVQSDEVLQQKIANVCEVKGLGLITVATVVGETNGFELFTSRGQLTSYAGYDVVEKESGTSIKAKGKISKKGNKHIRRALHFPALTVVKHEPQFKQLFERVVDKSAIKMKGYVAVQRKLLILIYTLFKNDVPYDPEYLQKKIEQQKQLASSKIGRQDTNPAYSGCLL